MAISGIDFVQEFGEIQGIYGCLVLSLCQFFAVKFAGTQYIAMELQKYGSGNIYVEITRQNI